MGPVWFLTRKCKHYVLDSSLVSVSHMCLYHVYCPLSLCSVKTTPRPGSGSVVVHTCEHRRAQSPTWTARRAPLISVLSQHASFRAPHQPEAGHRAPGVLAVACPPTLAVHAAPAPGPGQPRLASALHLTIADQEGGCWGSSSTALS